MSALHKPPRATPRIQFSLAELFQFTTVCAVLLSLSGLVGIGACVCLMMLALALWTSQGLGALLALAGASITAEWQPDVGAQGTPFYRGIIVITIAVLLVAYYRVRQNWRADVTR